MALLQYERSQYHKDNSYYTYLRLCNRVEFTHREGVGWCLNWWMDRSTITSRLPLLWYLHEGQEQQWPSPFLNGSTGAPVESTDPVYLSFGQCLALIFAVDIWRSNFQTVKRWLKPRPGEARATLNIKRKYWFLTFPSHRDWDYKKWRLRFG